MIGTKALRKDSAHMDADMPPNMRRTTAGYQYRRVVPSELREALGKREIKRNLGSDFKKARLLHAQLEVETNTAFAAARTCEHAEKHWSADELRHKRRKVRAQQLDAAEPELGAKLGSLWLAASLEADLERRRSGSLDEHEFQELTDTISDILPRVNRALATGNVAAFYPVVSGLLTGKGYELVGTDDAIQKLLHDFLQCVQIGYKTLYARQQGEMSPKAPANLAPPLKAAWEKKSKDHVGPSWEDLLSYWVKDRERPARSVKEATRFIQWLKEHSKKAPAELKKAEITAWLQNEREVRGNSAETLQKKGALVGAVFSTSFKDEKLTSNPFLGYDYKRFASKKGMESEEEREPFTDEELKLIFSTKGVFTQSRRLHGGGGYQTRVWYTLLGYFTGARLDEIGSLKVDSILSENGIDYIKIRYGKNANSVRDVPLHPDLIKLGFLEYVTSVRSAGYSSLWYSLKSESTSESSPSGIFGKWFNHHIRERLKLPKSKVFHSFRHNFVDTCRNSGIDEKVHKALTGHSAQDVGDKYGAGFKLSVKADAVKKLKFDIPIQLPI
jgi:integrase